MDMKMDLRIRKTYRALTDTFIQMMQEMDFADVTVNELCERSLVGRGTFYKHFADKYEFLSFLIREQYGSFLTEVAKRNQEQSPEAFFLTLLSSCLDFFEQSPALMSALKNAQGSSVIERVVTETILPDMTQRMKEMRSMGYDIPFSPQLTAELAVGIGNQTVLWWLRNRENVQKDVFMSFLRRNVNALMTSEISQK